MPKCGSQRAGALQPGTECPACLSRRPNSAGRTNANASIVEPPKAIRARFVPCTGPRCVRTACSNISLPFVHALVSHEQVTSGTRSHRCCLDPCDVESLSGASKRFVKGHPGKNLWLAQRAVEPWPSRLIAAKRWERVNGNIVETGQIAERGPRSH